MQEAVTSTYRQLLNRIPLAVERLKDAESQFRNVQLTAAEFVAQVATGGCSNSGSTAWHRCGLLQRPTWRCWDGQPSPRK